MKWFYDLKISAKLLLSFILVALIAGVVGYEGISSLRTADESDTILFERNTVPLSAMVDLVGHFQRMRANGLDLLIARTPEEHQKALEAIQGRSAEIDQDKAIIQKTIISADVQQKMDELTKADNYFDRLFKQFISMCTSDNDAGAEALWKGDLDKARKDEQNALSAMDDILTQRAQNRSNKNSENADAAVRNMIIIVIAAMIIAIALGLFLSKVISNPLKKAGQMIREMGKGHLSGRMNLDTKDELGEMAKTFDKFSDDLQKIVVGTLVKISEGDTSVNIKPMDGEDEIAPALQRLNVTIKNLISEVNSLSQDAVEGKLSSRGDAGNFKGGFKEIVQGINATIDAVVEPINESGRVLEIIARGDLTARMTGDYKGDYRKIKDNINGMADSFSQALSEVSESVQATASAANEISSSSEQMAAGAQEQSQQATEVAGAIEEMTKTVYETAKNANEAADMSRTSRVAAEK
ncbi:MAG TPA: MCP four helix bundle domain-containing protein, partial [Ignavibacteriales bacterium]|nr:MCP four helix bundle domain-containing protein [Ignavibacteriales bacterium]